MKIKYSIKMKTKLILKYVQKDRTRKVRKEISLHQSLRSITKYYKIVSNLI